MSDPLDIRPSGFNPSLKPLKKLYKPRAYKRQFMVRQMALREYEGLEINLIFPAFLSITVS